MDHFHRKSMGNQWIWPFELFHWIFVWFHIVCDRYTPEYAHFTFSDTIWPLLLSPNFRTEMNTLAETASYCRQTFGQFASLPSPSIGWIFTNNFFKILPKITASRLLNQFGKKPNCVKSLRLSRPRKKWSGFYQTAICHSWPASQWRQGL